MFIIYHSSGGPEVFIFWNWKGNSKTGISGRFVLGCWCSWCFLALIDSLLCFLSCLPGLQQTTMEEVTTKRSVILVHANCCYFMSLFYRCLHSASTFLLPGCHLSLCVLLQTELCFWSVVKRLVDWTFYVHLNRYCINMQFTDFRVDFTFLHIWQRLAIFQPLLHLQKLP